LFICDIIPNVPIAWFCGLTPRTTQLYGEFLKMEEKRMEKVQIEQIIKTYGRKEGDTGSTEVQIALLTARIQELTAHLDIHKNDNHSRRGLLMLVSQRKSLLKYLEKKDITKQRELKKSLSIR